MTEWKEADGDMGAKRYDRLTKADRRAIEAGLRERKGCREIASSINRSPSTVSEEVHRNRTWMARERRASRTGPKATSHGPHRPYAAFCALGQEARERTCEMDTVIGRSRDSKCLLTLCLRPCKAQLALLLEGKEADAVASALDELERALGDEAFSRLLGAVLADNGPEFLDADAIERSVLGDDPRCRVFYCDVRASQQKGGCERNHVELRKILPKGRGISFDGLEPRDCAVLMSHLSSQPRPSLMGLSPLAMLRAADPEAAEALMAALGIEEVPYERLDMTLGAINADRTERGAAPLA